MKKILRRAFEIYKEIDDIKGDEETKLLAAIEKAPLNYWVESEPEIDSARNTIILQQQMKLHKIQFSIHSRMGSTEMKSKIRIHHKHFFKLVGKLLK